MTTTDLAVREPRTVALSNDQLQFIANTEFVPAGLRGNLPAIMACVATGRALGIDDMSSLRLIHMVNGRPTFSAELMVQIVRRHGHSITGESTEGSCTVVGTRADNGDSITVTWTMAMAQRAGLANKPTWKAYPEALLWARAASQLCRQLFPDCFAGATYTAEELEDSDREPQAAEATALTAPIEPAASAASGDAGRQPSRSEKPITEPQKKKANVLVGTLRDALRLTTEEVYLAAGRTLPELAEGEVLRWSPLRESLTRAEASLLIDRLGRYDASEETRPPVEVWAADEGAAVSPTAAAPAVDALVLELLDLLAEDKRAAAVAMIEKKQQTLAPGGLEVWLSRQIELARKAAA